MAEQQGNLPAQTLNEFQRVTNQYLEDYTTPPKYAQKTAAWLRERWNPKTIGNFYGLLCSLDGVQTTASFTTYELEAVLAFYREQVFNGAPLTLFDRYILEGYLSRQPKNKREERQLDEEMADDIRVRTGVKIDTITIQRHRHILVYGRVTKDLVFHPSE